MRGGRPATGKESSKQSKKRGRGAAHECRICTEICLCSIVISLPAIRCPAPPACHRYTEISFFFFPVMCCCAAFCTVAVIIKEMAAQRYASPFCFQYKRLPIGGREHIRTLCSDPVTRKHIRPGWELPCCRSRIVSGKRTHPKNRCSLCICRTTDK